MFSYGFAAIQCHLSSFGPSNWVFPLDQKPRWLQSAGVGKEGIQYKDWNGIRWHVLVVQEHKDRSLFIYVLFTKKMGWVGNGEEKHGRQKQRDFYFFSNAVLTSQLFLKGKQSTGSISVHVWLLSYLLPLCNFASDHDRGATLQGAQWHTCSTSTVLFLPRQWDRQIDATAVQLFLWHVKLAALCASGKSERKTWLPLCHCPCLPCSPSLLLSASLPLSTGFSSSSSQKLILRATGYLTHLDRAFTSAQHNTSCSAARWNLSDCEGAPYQTSQ